MINLKKQLNIILFLQKYKKNPFIIFLPKILTKITTNHGISYIYYFSNIGFTKKFSNLNFLIFNSQIQFLQKFFVYFKQIISFKYKTLYFSPLCINKFQFNLVLNFKTFFFIFFNFFIFFKKRILYWINKKK